MAEFVNEMPRQPKRQRRGLGGDRSHPEPPLVEIEVPPAPPGQLLEEQIARVSEQLAQIREESNVYLPWCSDFYCNIRGGLWTFKKRK